MRPIASSAIRYAQWPSAWRSASAWARWLYGWGRATPESSQKEAVVTCSLSSYRISARILYVEPVEKVRWQKLQVKRPPYLPFKRRSQIEKPFWYPHFGQFSVVRDFFYSLVSRRERVSENRFIGDRKSVV